MRPPSFRPPPPRPSSAPYVIEVVVSSVRSSENAERGGATRLELCSALSAAGVTPSEGLLRTVKARVRIPVFVMIRPREGDFCYDGGELDVMRAEIDAIAAAGADGFVFGVSKRDGQVDVERTHELVKRCHGLPVVFHRAIDIAPDPFEALDAIVDAGCVRVMTSGGAHTAPEGIERIVAMHEYAGGRVTVMPGGAIRADTFHEVLRPELLEYHLSGRTPIRSPLASRLFDLDWAETDEDNIRSVVEAAARLAAP